MDLYFSVEITQREQRLVDCRAVVFDPEPVLSLLEDMLRKPAGSSSTSPKALNSRSASDLSEQPKSRYGLDRQRHSSVYSSYSQPGVCEKLN